MLRLVARVGSGGCGQHSIHLGIHLGALLPRRREIGGSKSSTFFGSDVAARTGAVAECGGRIEAYEIRRAKSERPLSSGPILKT
jgi:hypothetical protein